jgi:hypothetical protein
VLTSLYIDHTAEVSICDLQSANETQWSFAKYRFTEFTSRTLHITVWARLHLLKHACSLGGGGNIVSLYVFNVYCFYDQYNKINNFIFIGSPPPLRHVSAGNYCHHLIVLK